MFEKEKYVMLLMLILGTSDPKIEIFMNEEVEVFEAYCSLDHICPIFKENKSYHHLK